MPHPGQVLLEEFLKEYDISQNRLGREIGMSPRATSYDLEEASKEIDLRSIKGFEAA